MNHPLPFALGLTLLLCGCSQADKKTESAPMAIVVTPNAAMAPPPAADAEVRFTPPVVQKDERASMEEVPDQDPLPAKTLAPIPAPRLLVYHADLRLKVTSLAQASASIDRLVRRSGGYTSASAEAREDGEWRQETTIRVRPRQFGTLLATLAALGKVEQKKLTTDDVTAEHADVAARLRTKRALEQRYLALLSQAKKVSDMLEIEEKVGQVREEIESTESRLKTLNDDVTYSTITLTCYQPTPVATPDAPVVSLGSRLVGAVYGGWSMLAGLLIGAVTMWPLLLLGAAAWVGVRRWRRRAAA